MEQPTIFNEFIPVINTETPKYEIFHWEANGYDDSDGGYMYYIPEAGIIYHDEWSTRYAGRWYSEAEKLLNKKKSISIWDGIESGEITEKEIIEALYNNGYVTPGICIDALYQLNKTLNLEVCCDTGRGFRGVGTLIGFNTKISTDIFGRTNDKRYAIIADSKNKKICKTRLRNIKLTDRSLSWAKKFFIDNANLSQVISVVHAKYYQFDYNPYTRERYYSLQKAVINVITENMMDINIEDYTPYQEKISKNPKHIEKIVRYKEIISEKYKNMLNWANSLDKIEGGYTPEELAKHTLYKYYMDKIDFIRKDEPDYVIQ